VRLENISEGGTMFHLSDRSMGQLVGVHPDLAFVVVETIVVSPVDFMVFDGVRTLQQQRELVKAGASWTMDSYHLDGLAVDLVPYINGQLRWDHGACKRINKALQEVALAHSIDIYWGYDMWGKDSVHFQYTSMRGKYDVRKLNHDLECKHG
jgi:peptidoglycan L-alanyl-D-glutamate endopeptidase CwlK